MGMKYAGLPLLVLLICLPGCFNWMKKKTDGHASTVKIARGSRLHQSAHSSLFLDDEVDELVFEEEGSDAFAPGFIKQDNAVRVVGDEGENIDQQRRSDQIEYGFTSIYFNYDQYKVRSDQKIALQDNFKSAKKAIKDNRIIVIEGHSCHSAGSKAYNMLLSEKRAQYVAAYLIEHEIPAEIIKVVGRGCEMPIVPYGDKRQQAPNRRVELYTLSK